MDGSGSVKILVLDHADEEEIARGVDPEPGSGDAPPTISTVGDGGAGGGGVRDHLKVHAPAGAGGHRLERFGIDVIGSHHFDGAGGEETGSVELAAAEEHFAEAGVVEGGGVEASAAGGAEGDEGGVGAVLVDGEGGAGALVDRGEAGELFLGDVEGGVVHAEGGEDALAEEVGEGLAGEFFDEVTLDVDGDAVGPTGAGRGEEGDLGEAVDHGLEGGARVKEAGFDDHFVDGGGGVEDVAEAARVGHEFAHGHGAGGIFQFWGSVGVFAGVDFEAGEGGDVAGDGVVELPFSFFVEHHHGDAGDGFGHGVDAEDGIGFEGAVGLEAGDFAVAGDEGDEAGDLFFVDEALHGGVEAGEAFGGEAEGFGRGGGEGIGLGPSGRGEGGGGEDGEGDSREGTEGRGHPSFIIFRGGFWQGADWELISRRGGMDVDAWGGVSLSIRPVRRDFRNRRFAVV